MLAPKGLCCFFGSAWEVERHVDGEPFENLSGEEACEYLLILYSYNQTTCPPKNLANFLLKDEEAMALKGGKEAQPHLRLVVNVLSCFVVLLTSYEMTLIIKSPFGRPLSFKVGNAH